MLGSTFGGLTKGLNKSDEAKLFEACFKFGLVLIGLALLKENVIEAEKEETFTSIEERIFYITKLIAPILLPMIGSLGDLKLEDIVG